MQIACTKKLADELGRPLSAPVDTSPLYSWRANLVQLGHRKAVVVMCDQNQYVAVLYGITAKHYANLDWLILDAIRHTMLKQRLNPEIVERYLSGCGPISYVKNTGSSGTARLTKASQRAAIAMHVTMRHDNKMDALGVFANHEPVGITGEFYHPEDRMAEDLKAFGIEPIYKYRAFELTATLELLHSECSRDLIIPADITFFQLHRLMQAAFAWRDFHEFDFKVLDDNCDEDTPAAILVRDEESLEYEKDARLAAAVPIAEYLPEHKHLLYTYDFGDDWRHHIKMTGVIEAYTGAYPVCVSGVGNAPPEDVGGKYGYADYLEIMANKKHPEYAQAKAWSDRSLYYGFDLKSVNWKMSNAMMW